MKEETFEKIYEAARSVSGESVTDGDALLVLAMKNKEKLSCAYNGNNRSLRVMIVTLMLEDEELAEVLISSVRFYEKALSRGIKESHSKETDAT